LTVRGACWCRWLWASWSWRLHHQPVILLAGYFIIPQSLPILVKYLVILSLALGITLGLYEFAIRRVNVMRRMFGMKARGRAVPANPATAQATEVHAQLPAHRL